MAKKSKIKEGLPGTSMSPAADIIPDAARKLPISTSSYEFYYYKKADEAYIYVQTTSYHPGILKIPLSTLEKLIASLKQGASPKTTT